MGKVGKGIFKMQKSQFKPGHKVTKTGGKYRRVIARKADGTIILQGTQNVKRKPGVKRPIRRFTASEFKKIVKKGRTSDFSIPGPDGTEGTAILLRPKSELPLASCSPAARGTSSFELSEGTILVEKASLMEALNSFIEEHSETTCKSLHLDLVNFLPWGHYVKARVACTNCSFLSAKHYKLYEEVEKRGKGPREAKGNLRLQYLLQEMPIGNEKVRLILAALGIRAGSRSGMQSNANKVGKATIKLNEQDMGKWAEEVKSVLAARGVESPHIIAAATDGRYDGASLRSWVTPGLGATAATGVMVERITGDEKVIAMVHYNKVCPLGTRLRRQGQPAICGQGENSHAGCTATMPYYEDISERQMGKDMARQLQEDHGITISHITTDGDALASQGIADAYKEKGIAQEVSRFADLTHLGALQRKHIMQHKFSSGAFGANPDGESWLYDERIKCRQALANDVEVRCAITVQNIFKHYQFNVEKVTANAQKVVGYMLKCYSGDHSKCHTAPLAKLTGCTGKPQHTWFDTSAHLSSQRMSYLDLNTEDTAKLLEVINMKLGTYSIPLISQLATTQKVESVNHALNVSDPKTYHWSRNAKARNHAAVHRVNNGPANSIMQKLAHGGCSLNPDQPAAKTIQNYDRRLQYSKEYKRQPHVSARTRELKSQKIADYYKHAWKKNNPCDYLKHQLDEARTHKQRVKALVASGGHVFPGTSSDEHIATLNDELTSARASVKRAKKDLKRLSAEEEKKRAAASIKRKRTWKKNEKKHKEKQQQKLAKKNAYYNSGPLLSRTVKSEHCYSSVSTQ